MEKEFAANPEAGDQSLTNKRSIDGAEGVDCSIFRAQVDPCEQAFLLEQTAGKATALLWFCYVPLNDSEFGRFE